MIPLKYKLGLLATILIIIVDFIFLRTNEWFFFIFILSFYTFLVPIWLDYYIASMKIEELNNRFPEFVRAVSASIKSGMSISQSIIYVSDSDYGALSPYVKKMANQIEWGISIENVLSYFSYKTHSPVIKRSIKTIIEGEKAGGQMDEVLNSIVDSLIQLKEMNDERKATIQSQVAQNYIIYLVFLIILIVLQNMLIPTLSDMQDSGLSDVLGGGAGGGSDTGGGFVMNVEISMNTVSEFFSSIGNWFLSMNGIFMMITIVQAFFSGLVLGKMATGSVSSGTKHSFVMMTLGFIVMTLSQKMFN